MKIFKIATEYDGWSFNFRLNVTNRQDVLVFKSMYVLYVFVRTYFNRLL